MNPISQRIPLQGIQLIEASAGTGKTYTIATLFVRVLIERDLDIEKLLVVTYTRAATAELQARVRQRLSEALDTWSHSTGPTDGSLHALWATRSASQRKQDLQRLRTALGNYDRASISTIHGFCQRVLQDNAFASRAPLQAELMMSERPLLQEIVHDFWASHAYDAPPFIVAALNVSTVLSDLLKTAQDTVHKREAVVIPEHVDAAAPAEPSAFHASKRQLAERWALEGQRVIDTIAKWPHIHQNKYKSETVATRWHGVISSYLRGDAIAPPDELTKLGSVALSSSATKGGTPPALAISQDIDALLALAKPLTDAVSRWQLKLRWDLIREVRAEIDRRKAARDQVAFDDLLRGVRDALASDEGRTLVARLRQSYPVALVDEFQDTDPVQYAVFRAIYDAPTQDRALYLIGDPKQAIYRFRGADVFTYMEAVDSVGGEPHRLRDNWRSDPSLIDAVNRVFSASDKPFVYDRIGFLPASAAPTAREHLEGQPHGALTFVFPAADQPVDARTALTRTCEHNARHIADLIASNTRIDGRAIAPKDIAVLCRTNKQAAELQESLRALRIPTARDGDASVFESTSALELDRILSAIAQPDDPALLRVALTTAILGMRADEILTLDDDDSGLWEQWVLRVRSWNTLWLQRGLAPMMQALLNDRDTRTRLLGLNDGERRLTDVGHLTELLQRHAADHHVGPLSLVQWLRTMRTDDEARGTVDDAQLRLESDAHAVKLTTIHRSKGLEYPIVYCPFLWQGPPPQGSDALLFHANAHSTQLTIDIHREKDPLHKELAAQEALAEDVRLLYVALTRARHRCVVSWCSVKGSDRSALAYVLLRGEGTRAGHKGKDKKDEAGPTPASLLHTLAERSGGCIGIDTRTLDHVGAYTPGSDQPTVRSARHRTRRIAMTPRVTSFSRLTQTESRLSRDAEEGLDHDTRTLTPHALLSEADAGVDVPLAGLDAGPHVGLWIHDVLERSDFSIEARESLRERVRVAAPRHGIAATDIALVESGMDHVLGAPLGHGPLGFRLQDITDTDRVAEVEFMFPLRESIHAQGLADLLARHDTPWLPDTYVRTLRGMGFSTFAGYLRGYIDLCLRRDGRYYVLDYKTNHLGRGVDHYAHAHLGHAMGEHHYHLQALIYCVALHRHLSVRLRSYDYDACFGGFLYLFLRGMSPTHPVGHGVWHGRPSGALMKELSHWLAGDATHTQGART